MNNGREGLTEVVPATDNDEPPKHLNPYALGGTTNNKMSNDLTTTPPINPPYLNGMLYAFAGPGVN